MLSLLENVDPIMEIPIVSPKGTIIERSDCIAGTFVGQIPEAWSTTGINRKPVPAPDTAKKTLTMVLLRIDIALTRTAIPMSSTTEPPKRVMNV